MLQSRYYTTRAYCHCLRRLQPSDSSVRTARAVAADSDGCSWTEADGNLVALPLAPGARAVSFELWREVRRRAVRVARKR